MDIKSNTNFEQQLFKAADKLRKKIDPLQELKRLSKLHIDFLYNEKDRYLISEFKKKVEANLIFYLNSDKRFQDYESFKENYLLETKNLTD